MTGKKIGLMTCFLDNCGACLQAYALQECISKLGFTTEILRFTEPEGYYRASFRNSSRFLDIIRCVKSKSFRKHYYSGMYRVTAFNRFRKKYLNLSTTEYSTNESLVPQPSGYDAFVCGSDQIWNPTFYRMCNPAYYLAFVNDETPKIAYAPSIGLADIPEEYKDDFVKYINRLDALSVRESRGCEIIYKYTGKTAKHVVDPTILLGAEEWKKLVKKKHGKRYIFCYLFGTHEYYIDVIDRLANQLNCEVKIFPIWKRDLNPAYKQVVNAGPIDFLSLIYNAEFVLTDSFHATVFSILFEKSFYTLYRDSDSDIKSMNSRIYSLLDTVGLRERLLTEQAARNLEATQVSSFTLIRESIEVLRKESLQYLQEALRR